jgi:hypothetical protein
MITIYDVTEIPEQIGNCLEENETNLKYAEDALSIFRLQGRICWLVYIN